MNINVNYELWMILMYQYRLISFNKGATVVGDFKMDKAMDIWQNEKKNDVYVYVSLYICVCMYTVNHSTCQTLCNPMKCNIPESSVHEIFQARILE